MGYLLFLLGFLVIVGLMGAIGYSIYRDVFKED